MQRTYNYFTNYDNSTTEIDSMNSKEVGRAIKVTYDRLRGQYRLLSNLHDRLGKVRSDKKRPDTKKKVLKLLKLRNLPSKEEERLRQVIETAIILMESEKDYDFVKKVLQQGVLND
tara:strand:- start:147 stop:494 length:348 start_codon:yes stop_codon:yes gene_type:complete